MINPVARGFIPARLRSSRKPNQHGTPDTTQSQVSGPLRSPTGINPLTTGVVVIQVDRRGILRGQARSHRDRVNPVGVGLPVVL